MQVQGSFNVYQERVAARLGKGLQVAIRFGNHQVCLKRQFSDGPQRFDHWRTDTDIGYKMTVHHVDVNPIGACGFCLFDLAGQMRKIGCQNRGRQLDLLAVCHVSLFIR